MIITDFVNYLNSLDGELKPYATVNPQGLTEDAESIAAQSGVGNPIQYRYMDGSCSGEFIVHVYAKVKEYASKADIWLNALIHKFKDMNGKIELTQHCFFSVEPTSESRLYSRTDDGGYIYTASFNIEYDEF